MRYCTVSIITLLTSLWTLLLFIIFLVFMTLLLKNKTEFVENRQYMQILKSPSSGVLQQTESLAVNVAVAVAA